MSGRRLDFIVIGVQKGGTTSLWRHLSLHPALFLPPGKELPFFSKPESTRPGALEEYMERHFAEAPAGALLGTATPQYMTGEGEFDVERIAGAISTALPGVRLIALLRDPVARAGSQYSMAVRRGWEERSFEAAVEQQLSAAGVEEGRTRPSETNSYVAQGEYGRILGAYRGRFPAEQIHVEMTEDLAAEPGDVLDRVLAFLGLEPGFRPDRLDARLHRGGTRKLLDSESKAELFEFLERNVVPKLGEEAAQVKRSFGWFLAIWNVAPENERPALSEPTRDRLREHYETDAEALAELGFAAPWLEAWRAPATP